MKKRAKHPIQPLVKDEKGVPRFKKNKIVEYLLDQGPFDMNHLAVQQFSQEDHEQFAQLIGYSLGGFGELSYVSDDVYNAAEKMYEDEVTEQEARLENLENVIDVVRQSMRPCVSKLYRIHEDDLAI
jgi:hypothetical protein